MLVELGLVSQKKSVLNMLEKFYRKKCYLMLVSVIIVKLRKLTFWGNICCMLCHIMACNQQSPCLYSNLSVAYSRSFVLSNTVFLYKSNFHKWQIVFWPGRLFQIYHIFLFVYVWFCPYIFFKLSIFISCKQRSDGLRIK